jgi:hypothetical protein
MPMGFWVDKAQFKGDKEALGDTTEQKIERLDFDPASGL